MEFDFEEYHSEVIFTISNFDKKYDPIFKACFWQEDNGRYFKKFPINSKHLDKIKKHFKRNALEMFSQLGYFSECKWEDALNDFALTMEKEQIDWWLVGSCAACIRGIEFKPHDVDIMVDSKDIDRIADVFQKKLIIPIVNTNGWLTKDFGVIFWHARIDIASDPVPELDIPEPIDCGPYAKEHLEVVEWRGHKIKVPPIDLLLTVNRKRKRFERVKLIEEFIGATSS